MEKGTTIKLPKSLGGTTITIERIYEDPYEGTKFYGTQYDSRGNRISDITEVITFYNETNGIQVFDAQGRNITDDNRVVNQLVQQLKDILRPLGLSVKNNVDMDKFFREHPDVFADLLTQLYISNKNKDNFRELLMSHRPDLRSARYDINGITFSKDVFSDDIIADNPTLIEKNLFRGKKVNVVTDWDGKYIRTELVLRAFG
jgi:hypothetical protein